MTKLRLNKPLYLNSMPSSDQITESLAILIMGPPGGGKTTLGLQFPGVGVLNCDRNLAGPVRYLKSKGLYTPFKYETISAYDDDSDPPHKSGEIVDIKFAWDRCREITRRFIKDPDIKVIMLDTLTYIDQALYSHACRVQNVTELGGFQWQPYKRELHTWIAEVKSSGKLLLVNCHERPIFKPLGQGVKSMDVVDKYEPTISTNISSYFGYFFSDMWRCSLQDQGAGIMKCILQTHPNKMMDLKNSLLMEKQITGDYATLKPHIDKGLALLAQQVSARPSTAPAPVTPGKTTTK